MKRSGLFAVIFALVFALFTSAVQAAPKFADVKEDFWAADEIKRFTEMGVINGYPNETFRPESPIKRGEATKIIAHALNMKLDSAATDKYKDVDKKHPYYKEIAAVTNAGIMEGFPNGKFQSDKPLNRADMAIILTKAFDLKENGKVANFKDLKKDHYAYDQIMTVFANDITTGYPNNTFRPSSPTKRAEFVVFLDRALDLAESDNLAALLKKAYANEMDLNTYEYEGSLNFGLTLPESLTADPDLAGFTQLFKDVDVEISGAYQKDPMLMDADIVLTLKGDVETKLTIPMVMTEDKMWVKLPQSPLMPLPEEVDGKFIEFDMSELAELQGQPALDLDVQTELAVALYELFFDHFTRGFYSEVPADALNVPSGIDVQKVVKFELTNDNVGSFVKILFNGFLPEFFELAEDPEYAEALGLTVEDVEFVKEELAVVTENIDEIVSEIHNFVDIHKFEEYIVIDKNNVIAYDVVDMDLSIHAEGETFGIKLFADTKKNKINGDVKFKYGIPDAAEVVPFEELFDFEDFEGFEELEELEAI